MKQQELIKKLEEVLFNRDILKSNGISEKRYQNVIYYGEND